MNTVLSKAERSCIHQRNSYTVMICTLIGHPRSGSTVIVDSFGHKYPNIKNHHEIFNHCRAGYSINDKNVIMCPGFLNQTRCLKNEICEKIWSDYLVKNKNLVGNICLSKILFNQAPKEWGVWDRIIEDSDLIIYLKRKNQLNIVISLQQALETSRWIGEHKEFKKFIVNPKLIEEALIIIDQNIAYFNNRLKNTNTLEIYYEDLDTDWNKEVQKIQQKLSVPICLVNQSTKKQITIPHSDLVENYDELKKYFSVTKWSKFFD